MILNLTMNQLPRSSSGSIYAILWFSHYFTLRGNLGARVVRGPGRPPVPCDHFIGKHFEQRADQSRRCKLSAYTKSAQGNLKHKRTLISSVQSVTHIFVNSHVFKSGKPNRLLDKFIRFLLAKDHKQWTSSVEQ